MATRYWWKNATGAANWSATANWYISASGTSSLGAVPATTDDIILDSGSHSGSILFLDTARTCNSFVATGFKGGFSGSLGLSVTSTTTNRTSSALPLFAWGSAMTQSYVGTTTFAGSAANTGGWIFCNGTQFSGSVTFNNVNGRFVLRDSFKLPPVSTLTLTNGIVSASDSSVNIETGLISTATGTKTLTCPHLYLTGVGALFSTSTANLTSNITNIYVTGSTSTAKTLLFNTLFGSTNLYLGGSGSIAFTPGATFIPNVYVTNTGGLTTTFNIAATGTIRSLTFSRPVTWTNALSVVLTLQGSLTLLSTMAIATRTPALTFTTNNPTITLAGKTLLTGVITINGVAATAVGDFVPGVGLTISNNGSLTTPSSTTFTVPTLALQGSSLSLNSSPNTVTGATTISTAATSEIYNNALTMSTLNVGGSSVFNIYSPGSNTTGLLTINGNGTVYVSANNVVFDSISINMGAIYANTVGTNKTIICTNRLSTSNTFSVIADNIYTGTRLNNSSQGISPPYSRYMQCTNFYFTDTTGVLLNDNGITFTPYIDNIYILGSGQFTLSSDLNAPNVYVSSSVSSGNIALTLGSTYRPDVTIDTPASSLTAVEFAAAATINSLTFLDSTSWLNSNTAIVLTIQSDLTLTSTTFPDPNINGWGFLPCALVFGSSGNSTTANVTMAGNVFNNTVTINDATQTTYFLDNFTSNTSVAFTNTLYTYLKGNFSCNTLTNGNSSYLFVEKDLTTTTLVSSGTSRLYIGGVYPFPNTPFTLIPTSYYASTVDATAISTSTTATYITLWAGNISCDSIVLASNSTLTVEKTPGYPTVITTTGVMTIPTAGSLIVSGSSIYNGGRLTLNGSNTITDSIVECYDLYSTNGNTTFTRTSITDNGIVDLTTTSFTLSGSQISCNSIQADTNSTLTATSTPSNLTAITSSGTITIDASSTFTSTSASIFSGGRLTLNGNCQMYRNSVTCSEMYSTNGTIYLENTPVSCSGQVNLTTSDFIIERESPSFICGYFSLDTNASFFMGLNSRLIVAGAGDAFSSTTTTTIVTETNSIIEFTDTSASILILTLSGTGTYENIILNRGASPGTTLIRGSAVVPDGSVIRNFRDLGTAAHDILYGSNTYTILDTYDVRGSFGNVVNIARNAGAISTVLKKGNPGLVVCDYITVTSITAQDYIGSTTQGTWFAGPNSTLTGTTTGWSTTGSHATASIVRRLGSQGAG